eukprot:gene2198-2372_t
MEEINQPYEYITKNTQSNLLNNLIDSFNLWIQLEEEKIKTVKQIVQKLYNSSLLLDDIEDSSHLREGKPCAYRLFGVPQTINSANYSYFEALLELNKSNLQESSNLVLEELLLLHKGQGLDIFWRDHCKCPDESEYLSMVKNKIGSLFRISVGLMQNYSKNSTNFNSLLDDLSIFFQILDDYLNLFSMNQINKSFCEDFTEGKFSFPIIHHLTLSKDVKVLNILKQKTNEKVLLDYAIELMKETRSQEYTKQILHEYFNKLENHIQSLNGNSALSKIVKELIKKIE